MKKIIFLTIMFVVFGCSDNSVSADPTEVSADPVGTVTEPTDLTVPEETVTEPVTKSNPEETATEIIPSTVSQYIQAFVADTAKQYICQDAVDWTGFDISDLAIYNRYNDWDPYRDFMGLLQLEFVGTFEPFNSIKNENLKTRGCDKIVREQVTALYAANGIDNSTQMETDITNLCKLLDLTLTTTGNDYATGEVKCRFIQK